MSKVVIKEGAGIWHQMYRFRGGVIVAGSKIYQNKNWYYLGPFEISKVELFAKLFEWKHAISTPVFVSLLF